MTAVTSDPLVGRVVDGRYRVVSRIARGGMATVYLALDQRLDREVALKVMHAHLADGTDGVDFTSRFRREARAAARLAHPGLVGVYDQGVDGTTSYLTMEYVAGTNLRRTLRDRGAFSVGETLDALDAILDALAAAHRAGLVHRDVKPENVLLDTVGRYKLTDFGLARAVTEVTTTTAGTVLGTVAYMAPELIRATGCDARSDVYSVGILAYEMLTGTTPHTGDSPIQVAYQHVNADVPAPSSTFGELPVEIDDLVCALAARDPGNRPVDAGAALTLVRSTRAALDPGDLAARHVPGRGSTAELPDDGLELDAIPTTALATIDAERLADVIAHGGTQVLDVIADDDARRPARRGRSRAMLTSILVVLLVLAGAGGTGLWWFSSGPGAYTTVPEGLVGVPEAEAERALARAGLEPSTSTTYSDDVSEGSVVAVDPEGGEQVHRAGTVDVSVSLGVQMYTVPERLAGISEAQATSALKDAGFTVASSEHDYSDDVPAGTVVGASVVEGSEQRHDTVVTLTVSDGPAPVDVPSVIGLEKKAGVDALTGAGLEVTPSEEYSEKVPAGRIVSQTPAKGDAAKRGDAATVVVSKGPPLVEVPNVVDMKVEAAEKTLTDAGFTIDVKELFGARPLDRVLFQDKKAGAKIPKGSTIRLTVT